MVCYKRLINGLFSLFSQFTLNLSSVPYLINSYKFKIQYSYIKVIYKGIPFYFVIINCVSCRKICSCFIIINILFY